jgi:hypothetical protein
MNSVSLRYGPLLAAIFLVSFVAVGWQIVLMRCLLIARYHHFSFLVISCALLGFGAGGAMLASGRAWFEKNSEKVLRWGTLLLALSLPVCFRVGELLPLNVYFPPVAWGSTVAWWTLFWVIHSLPFLLAGLLIGLALMEGKEQVPGIYASNLAGSAAGAIGSIVLLVYAPANGLVLVLSLVVLASGGFLLFATRTGKASYAWGLAGAAIIVSAGLTLPPDRLFPLNVDQYKPLAYVQQLEKQGAAEKLISRSGPRGRIDVFSSSLFHSLLALSSREAPPPMDMLLLDGFQVGSVLKIRAEGEARFLESALYSLPYKTIPPKRVLILGETGGVHTWTARLTPADSITVVQPDANIVKVLQEHSSHVFDDPRIRIGAYEPRAFLDSTHEMFDVIQFAGLEGFAAGSGGIGGLREDYLATLEGYGKSLARLSTRGIACVVRGIQEPPRDNLKIIATWIEALERAGAKKPGNHLLLARDELSFVTLVGRSEFTDTEVNAFREAARKMSWEVEWFPGVRPEETNRIHVLPGPGGKSWYHEAVNKLLSGNRQEFLDAWLFRIEPARDDSPFFYDFFKWRSLPRLAEVFGPLWPARTEMGFLVLLISLLWAVTFASILIPGPAILLVRSAEGPSSKYVIILAGYFGCLGVGFMFVEMSFVQIFTRFFGDPVIAAGVVVGTFLFFAGIGSFYSSTVSRSIPGGIVSVSCIIGFLVLAFSFVFPVLLESAAGASEFLKYVIGIGVMAAPAFFMGMPFPSGLLKVHENVAPAVPLAWAINGFASVISACAAVLIAMVWGFSALLVSAAVAYLIAGGLSRRMG